MAALARPASIGCADRFVSVGRGSRQQPLLQPQRLQFLSYFPAKVNVCHLTTTRTINHYGHFHLRDNISEHATRVICCHSAHGVPSRKTQWSRETAIRETIELFGVCVVAPSARR
jgi:hypothetical protein